MFLEGHPWMLGRFVFGSVLKQNTCPPTDKAAVQLLISVLCAVLIYSFEIDRVILIAHPIVSPVIPCQIVAPTGDEYEVNLCVEEAGLIVTRFNEPKTTCIVTLTSPVMRDCLLGPTAPQGNSRCIDSFWKFSYCINVELSILKSLIYDTEKYSLID